MASSKERLRWEKWFSDVTARLERQKKSITRLVAANLEFSAALLEISHMPEYVDNEPNPAVQRAQEALARVAEPAAAAAAEAEELLAEEEEEHP